MEKKALSITYASSRSANLWELYQKIWLRWYLIPYHTSKFAPGSSSECWRNRGGGPRTLPHILWSCPHIEKYWARIFTKIEQVIGIQVTPSPGMAVLITRYRLRQAIHWVKFGKNFLSEILSKNFPSYFAPADFRASIEFE